MPQNRRYYLDFTADLHRVIGCIINHNAKGAQTFFNHAETIMDTRLMLESSTILSPECQLIWRELQKAHARGALAEQKVSDKLLTFTTIIFSRTIHS
jgi:hypothetical protein